MKPLTDAKGREEQPVRAAHEKKAIRALGRALFRWSMDSRGVSRKQTEQWIRELDEGTSVDGRVLPTAAMFHSVKRFANEATARECERLHFRRLEQTINAMAAVEDLLRRARDIAQKAVDEPLPEETMEEETLRALVRDVNANKVTQNEAWPAFAAGYAYLVARTAQDYWRSINDSVEAGLRVVQEHARTFLATKEKYPFRAETPTPGRKTARSRFVKRARVDPWTANLTAREWVHLGVAVGIDEPPTSARALEKLRKAYADLLDEPPTPGKKRRR